MKERRGLIRIDAALKAICDMGRGIKKSYNVKNISEGGALIILDTPLANGSEINISLDVPGDNIPIFVTGTITWQKKEGEKKDAAGYETGVKFGAIKGADKGRFAKFLHAQWLKLLERK
jgi:hypothetical protein